MSEIETYNLNIGLRGGGEVIANLLRRLYMCDAALPLYASLLERCWSTRVSR